MATWDDLRTLLAQNFNTIERSPRLIEVTIACDPQPPVTTFVSSALDLSDNLWVSIDALVGQLSGIDLGTAVRAMGDNLCGGLASMPIQGMDYLVVRHAMPVQDLPPSRMNDVLIPLYAASGGALEMKQRFGSTGTIGGFNQL